MTVATDLPALPWLDEPDRPGWYWYRGQDRVTRGPVAVFRAYGTLCYQDRTKSGWRGGEPRPCSGAHRQWAGPLPRPEGAD